MRIQPSTDSTFLASLKRIAPGTTIREGIDDIIRARLGALIVVGEPSRLSFLFSGGIRLDVPLTAQHLYELAKLDGAIIIDSAMTRLVYANVQLMPDPKIPSAESGTRHRTAERVAKQTDALVISISQQRETVTLFLGDHRYQLGLISDVLARMNQALATLGTYRQRLDHALTRLTALEFRGAAALDDVLVVLQRAELATRMAQEIEASCAELGQEGRLVRLQLEDLMAGVPREKAAVIFDYVAESEPGRAMGRARTARQAELHGDLRSAEDRRASWARGRGEPCRRSRRASGLPGALANPPSARRHRTTGRPRSWVP